MDVCENATFVFFATTTTGVPWEERNKTKLTGLCFIAVSRESLWEARPGPLPAFNKMSYFLNPEKDIQMAASQHNGITDDYVQYSTTFKDIFQSLYAFLDSLPKPVCLISHNGNSFHYKMLMTECYDLGKLLPEHLRHVESRSAFMSVLKSKGHPSNAYKLPDLARALLGEDLDSKEAESICVTLMKCVIACGGANIVSWADKSYKYLKDVQPYQRY